MNDFLAFLGVILIVIFIAMFSVAMNTSSWNDWCKRGEIAVINQKVYKCVSAGVK